MKNFRSPFLLRQMLKNVFQMLKQFRVQPCATRKNFMDIKDFKHNLTRQMWGYMDVIPSHVRHKTVWTVL